MDQIIEIKKRSRLRFNLLRIKHFLNRPSIYLAPGTHIITGYPGAGKTLLMSHIINMVDKEKYFFLSNIEEFNDVPTFEIASIFKSYKQTMRFPLMDSKGRKLYGIIFDEINRTFNKRNNGNKEYNEMFIGLIEFIITHRHQKVPRLYFIGQKLELQDTQLLSLFKYQHDIIKSKKRANFKIFKQSGYLAYVPVKMNILNKIKGQQDDYIQLKIDKVKISYKDVSSYNTLGVAKDYEKLVEWKLLTKY